MILGAIGYGYSISTVASCFGQTAYGRLAFQDRLNNMEFYLNVRVCVCTYVHVCMYVHTYVRMYVCMYVCTYVRMYVRTYVCMYVRMYVRTYVRTYVCMYVCNCIHPCYINLVLLNCHNQLYDSVLLP